MAAAQFDLLNISKEAFVANAPKSMQMQMGFMYEMQIMEQYKERVISLLPAIKSFLVSGEFYKIQEIIDRLTTDELLKIYTCKGVFINAFSWTIPDVSRTQDIVKIIKEHGVKSVLEVGAGNALEMAIMKTLPESDGIVFNATDDWSTHDSSPANAFMDVETMEGRDAVETYPADALMIQWPQYNSSMAVDCLRKFKGNVLIYTGEDYGGCTADDAFFEELNNWEKVHCFDPKQWNGIYDYINIYVRKSD